MRKERRESGKVEEEITISLIFAVQILDFVGTLNRGIHSTEYLQVFPQF